MVTLSKLPSAPTTPTSHDHGASFHGGLGDDDHTQYALLLGRAGGQTIRGGTGVGDILLLQGTSGGMLVALDSAIFAVAGDSYISDSLLIGASAAAATSAVLELQSTTGAILLSRMTTAQRDALTAVDGMVIYNSTTAQFERYQAGAWDSFGGAGHTIRDEGTDRAARTGLNFRGGLVSAPDDAAGDETEVRVGMQPDGTDLFATADATPHLSIGGTGKTNRISDVIELPTSTAPGALATFGRMYYGGTIFRQALVAANLAFDFGIGGPVGLLFDKGQLGGWSSGTDATDGAWGLVRPVTITGTPTFATGINGREAVFPTAATTGDDAGLSTALLFEKDAQPQIQIKFSLNHNTNVRFFCGLTDQTLATMVGSDTPAGSFNGLSFSTSRGDTNWKWITFDGVGAQTTNDSGIAVDTAVHFMRMMTTASNALVNVLYNASQVEQDSNFFAANTLALGTDVRFVCGLETLEDGVKSITAYYFTAMNNR